MKSGGQQVQTNTLDPQTQAYINSVRQKASGIGNTPFTPYAGPMVAGPDGRTLTAANNFGTIANLGLTGMRALGGDASAEASMMNPYLTSLNPVWDQLRKASLSSINDQATQAGAFGGSRQGVAQGVALSGIANDQANQTYGAFNDAMGRASQAANLGFGANQELGNVGQYLTGINQSRLSAAYNQWLMGQQYPYQQLNAMEGATGPYGTTASQSQQRNVGSGVLGGAATGAAIGSVIPGIGTGIGALAGGILGLF